MFAEVGLGTFLIGTLYMQLVLGYSPMKTDVSFLALTVSVVAGARVARSLVNRVGIRPLVADRHNAGGTASTGGSPRSAGEAGSQVPCGFLIGSRHDCCGSLSGPG